MNFEFNDVQRSWRDKAQALGRELGDDAAAADVVMGAARIGLIDPDADMVAAALAVDVDARLAQRGAKLLGRLLAAHVQAPFAAFEASADVLDGRRKLLFTGAEERADMIALLIRDARRLIHGGIIGPRSGKRTSTMPRCR